jgi:hypothetical protein
MASKASAVIATRVIASIRRAGPLRRAAQARDAYRIAHEPADFSQTAKGPKGHGCAIILWVDRIRGSERRGRIRRPKGCVRVWRFKRDVRV